MGRFTPKYVGGRTSDETEWMSPLEIADKTIPTLLLIVAVLGGIYTGWLTPVEAGAAGSLLGLLIAAFRKKLTLQSLWQALLETGHNHGVYSVLDHCRINLQPDARSRRPAE